MSTNFKNSDEYLDLISQAEAARLRGVSRQAIAKLVTIGRLKTFIVAGRPLVLKSDVESYVPMPAGRPKGGANG